MKTLLEQCKGNPWMERALASTRRYRAAVTRLERLAKYRLLYGDELVDQALEACRTLPLSVFDYIEIFVGFQRSYGARLSAEVAKRLTERLSEDSIETSNVKGH